MMKRMTILLLPVIFASLAVGFVLHRGLAAEDVSLSTGAAADEYIASASEQTVGNLTADAPQVPGDIVLNKVIDSVVFSHQKHAVDLGFDCSVCHTNIFQMKFGTAESQPDFNMKGLGEGKYCGSCHSSDKVAFSSGSECARCHQGVKGLEITQMVSAD
jgi:c(7)-type cytochrome triheme protein